MQSCTRSLSTTRGAFCHSFRKTDRKGRFEERVDMRKHILLALAITFGLLLGNAGPEAADCDAIGKVQFLCGIVSPEDFALVPGSDWILTSGNRAGQGAIRALNVRTTIVATLFPSATVETRADSTRYPGCPGPVDSADP